MAYECIVEDECIIGKFCVLTYELHISIHDGNLQSMNSLFWSEHTEPVCLTRRIDDICLTCICTCTFFVFVWGNMV